MTNVPETHARHGGWTRCSLGTASFSCIYSLIPVSRSWPQRLMGGACLRKPEQAGWMGKLGPELALPDCRAHEWGSAPWSPQHLQSGPCLVLTSYWDIIYVLFSPLKVYNSTAFSIFAELYDHNHNLMNIFVPSQKKPYVLLPPPPPPPHTHTFCPCEVVWSAHFI